MEEYQQLEAKKLLKATFDILKKCDESPFVLSALEVTAIWDEVECDGYCLKEEIECLLTNLDD